ncbi:MAG: hypothetical protein IPL61_15245 [Myxococcales bacterium]|nr:hypothetical protein [Myxococcales bacterium]
MRTSSIVLAAALTSALVASACKKSDKPAPAAGTAAPAAGTAAPAAGTAAPAAGTAAGTAAPAAEPAAPAAAPAAGTTLKLTEVPPKVGDKRTKIEDNEIALQMDAKGKKVDVQVVGHKEEQLELLELAGDVMMKVKASYPSISNTQTIAGKVQAKPNVLAGKAYVVWSEAGEIKATTADGAAVSAEELAELADENDELGKPDVMQQILANRTWTIGEPYVFTADDLAKLKARANPGKPVPSAISFTLRSFDATVAVFELTMSMVQAKGTEQLQFDMKGTARLELPSTNPIEMSMSGPISGTANGMPTTGTLTGKTTYSY